MSQGQNVTVDVLIGSKCHCGRSELGRFVQASPPLPHKQMTRKKNIYIYFATDGITRIKPLGGRHFAVKHTYLI